MKKFKHKKTGEIATYENGVLKSSGFCVELGVEPSKEIWEEISKKPLFRTEDGVDIYKGDNCWACNKETLKDLGKVNWSFFHPYNHALYFSTIDAAKEYILMNKPCLSVREVLNAPSLNDVETFFVARYLRYLVKQKI
jgi:hypothetical protein